jgi:hypothetical protein
MTAAAFSKDIGNEPLRIGQRILAYLILLALTIMFWWVAEERPFTPGSDLGYNLGLVGGLMMLTLLLYPIRKYWGKLSNFGSLRAWFVIHILFGVLGPVLVLLHSTFKLGSFNASMAFWSMVVVTLSGLGGRFVFTHVYFELGNRQAAQWEAERGLKKRADGGTHALDFAPEVRKWLEEYRELAYSAQFHRWRKFSRVIGGFWQKKRFIERCDAAILHAITKEMHAQNWAPARASGEIRVLHTLVAGYVEKVDQAARFTLLVNTLSWWQIMHVPFVYVLALSGIAHVVAVHMY